MTDINFSVAKLLNPMAAASAAVFNHAVENQHSDGFTLFGCCDRMTEQTYNGLVVEVKFDEKYAEDLGDGCFEDAGLWDAYAIVIPVGEQGNPEPLLFAAGGNGPCGGTESYKIWFDASGRVVRAEAPKESMAKVMTAKVEALRVEPVSEAAEAVIRKVLAAVI